MEVIWATAQPEGQDHEFVVDASKFEPKIFSVLWVNLYVVKTTFNV